MLGRSVLRKIIYTMKYSFLLMIRSLRGAPPPGAAVRCERNYAVHLVGKSSQAKKNQTEQYVRMVMSMARVLQTER